MNSTTTSETVVCVGAVVTKADSILAIRQASGHPLEGQWTIPWGKLEAGESPSAAALRETSEEAGIVATVDGLIGVQELPDPWTGWIAVIYLCSHVDGAPTPDNRETDAARFLTLEQLDALAEPIEPWSEWLMRRVLNNDYASIGASESNPYLPSTGYI